MQWLLTNWVWVLVGIAFVAMHIFGHGGHGAPGGKTRSPDSGETDSGETPESDVHRNAGGHRH